MFWQLPVPMNHKLILQILHKVSPLIVLIVPQLSSIRCLFCGDKEEWNGWLLPSLTFIVWCLKSHFSSHKLFTALLGVDKGIHELLCKTPAEGNRKSCVNGLHEDRFSPWKGITIHPVSIYLSTQITHQFKCDHSKGYLSEIRYFINLVFWVSNALGQSNHSRESSHNFGFIILLHFLCVSLRWGIQNWTVVQLEMYCSWFSINPVRCLVPL